MQTEPNRTTDPLASSLTAALRFGHGFQACVAAALNWPHQRVTQMIDGGRVSPFEQVKRIISTLRANANPQADVPFLVLADDLDFVAHRRDHSLPADAASLAGMLREVADVVDAHAKATDGVNDDADELCLLSALRDLEAAVCAFADRLKSRIKETSPRRIAAWTVRA